MISNTLTTPSVFKPVTQTSTPTQSTQGFLAPITNALKTNQQSSFSYANPANSTTKPPVTGLVASANPPPAQSNFFGTNATQPQAQVTGTLPVPQPQQTAIAGNPSFTPSNQAESTVGTTQNNYATTQPNNPAGAPANPQAPAPVKGLFPSVVSSLANPQTNPMVTDSYNKAQDYQQQLTQSRLDEATALQHQNGPIPIGDITGRQGALANYYAQSQGALAAGLQGESNLVSGGNTQQGLQQSAQTSAANLAAPQQNFPFVFDPTTGTYKAPGVGGSIGGTNGSVGLAYNPTQDSQTLAQQVMNHQINYSDAINSLSYGSNGNNAAGQLNAAITAAGGNPSILQTQGGIQQSQEQTSQAYQSAHQQASNLQSQLTDLIKTFNLNPSDFNAANLAIQTIAKNTSDPRYQILSNYLADVASRYSQILTPPGGSATDTTRSVATGMLNGIASGGSIIDVMNALDAQAQAVSAGVKTIGNTNSSSTSGGTSGAGGWGSI